MDSSECIWPSSNELSQGQSEKVVTNSFPVKHKKGEQIFRQELADLVSSTKESISRTLSEFKNDRLIDNIDRKVILKSVDLHEVLNRMG